MFAGENVNGQCYVTKQPSDHIVLILVPVKTLWMLHLLQLMLSKLYCHQSHIYNYDEIGKIYVVLLWALWRALGSISQVRGGCNTFLNSEILNIKKIKCSVLKSCIHFT